MQISVIIPTLNEASNLVELIPALQSELQNVRYEIIVVDGGSTDHSVQIATEFGNTVLSCNVKCRAKQMNEGAGISKGDILYFVHADSRPPKGFFTDIKQAFSEGFDMGCFRFKFDSKRFLLRVNSYFTRFDREMCRGGDQTLFITSEKFKGLGGYDANLRIMEEYDFMKRARRDLKFKIIPKDVIVSARKYEENSYFRVNLVNLLVFTSFYRGASQERLLKIYKTLLNHPKPEALE